MHIIIFILKNKNLLKSIEIINYSILFIFICLLFTRGAYTSISFEMKFPYISGIMFEINCSLVLAGLMLITIVQRRKNPNSPLSLIS